MAVYDRQTALATRLITAKGQTVTWRKVTDGAAGDSSKPWKPGASVNTDHTVVIVFLPDNSKDREQLRFANGSSVPEGNLVGYMAATTFTPTLKDVVIRGTEKIGLVGIEPLSPNGEIIMYRLRFNT